MDGIGTCLCSVQFSAQHPCLEEHAFAQVVLPKLCHSVLSAASISQQLLVRWWSTYPKDILAERVVRPLQSYITVKLQATKKLTLAVMNSIKVRPATAAFPASPPSLCNLSGAALAAGGHACQYTLILCYT